MKRMERLMLSTATLLESSVSGRRPGWSEWFSPAVRRVRPACWIGVPDCRAEVDPLLVVHGVQRDARGSFELFAEHAARSGRVLIAPLFDDIDWKGYQRVLGRHRADLGLLDILDRLREEGIIEGRRVELFGYSAGAQFAHRFALFHPQRVSRATVCAAGWYVFPDDQPYPRGLGAPERPIPGYSTLIVANLREFLQLPMRVVVGEYDDTVDDLTRSNVALDLQQGCTRLERARNWVRALEHSAVRHGVVSASVLEVLGGCGHDLRECLQSGAMPELLSVPVRTVSEPRCAATVSSITEGERHE